jgi:GntR family transcriptional repressor for pyruvate dehydrogenase complex
MAEPSLRLYQRVVEGLATSIRKGDFGHGDKLPGERELAERFGVSRPTIREAMIALEIHGLVEIRHGSGIYVIDTSGAPAQAEERPREDLNVGAFEILEARIIVEGGVAAIAAALVTEEDLEILDDLACKMQQADIAASVEADRQFHLHIARMTNNGPLIDTVENLWRLRTQSLLAFNIERRASGGGREARNEEHREVVAALRKRDPVAARQAMQNHLERVREYLLDATETEEMESLLKRQRATRRAISQRSVF